MKNWFLVSLAVMTFLVACGKKNKKQGQIGKTANQSTLDCDVKDKANAACKNHGKTTPNPAVEAEVDLGQGGNPSPLVPSGVESIPTTTESFPNELKRNGIDSFVMSLHLDQGKAVTSEFLISTNKGDESFTGLNVSCSEFDEETDNVLTDKKINPDELENINTNLFLMNNSQILATMKINKGKGAGVKPFLISCKKASDVNVESYKEKNEFQVKNLDEGLTVMDEIASNDSADSGVSVSFQCLSEENILLEKKKVLSDGLVLNRIKLTKGSSVGFKRAINKSFDGDVSGVSKKLSELDETSKDKKYVVITCN